MSILIPDREAIAISSGDIIAEELGVDIANKVLANTIYLVEINQTVVKDLVDLFTRAPVTVQVSDLRIDRANKLKLLELIQNISTMTQKPYTIVVRRST